MRIAIAFIGCVWVLTGLAIVATPRLFHETIPGLALMGPYSGHYIRDVGIAFAASGAVTVWGVWRRVQAVALAGTLWPALHGAFHLQIWSHRGFPLDGILAFDVMAVIAPAWLALAFAWRTGA